MKDGQRRAIEKKREEQRTIRAMGGGKEVARLAAEHAFANIHGVDITDDDLPSFIREDAETNISNAHADRERLEMKRQFAEAERKQEQKAFQSKMDADVNEINSYNRVEEAAKDEDEGKPGVGPGQLKSVSAALLFILAGNAYFTVRSVATGTRFTFRVSMAKPNPQFPSTDVRHFVSLLSGPENTSNYSYMGMIRGGKFALTRASRITESAPSFKAFRWVWEHLMSGKMPPKVELWHEGRCGRCGRKLTVPESIQRGIGPECAENLGL